ncbi:hypothetical protein EYF80_000360 [Liparis tanakae]|uniref:Uncharacterized protein n=1 Tax=Liparis tanakae TaxID=230148 RepID=A0A4Z2JIJ2_9TELE|nr:hypothetical protein EYF80_000360 [Liparis tanakae]
MAPTSKTDEHFGGLQALEPKRNNLLWEVLWKSEDTPPSRLSCESERPASTKAVTQQLHGGTYRTRKSLSSDSTLVRVRGPSDVKYNRLQPEAFDLALIDGTRQGGLALQQHWRRALPGTGMPEVCHTPAGNLQAIPPRQGAAEGSVKQRNRTSD